MANDHDSILLLRIQLLEQEVKKLQAIVKNLAKENPQPTLGQAEDDAILNLDEAHKLLNLPPHMIYSKAKSGELPSFKIGKQYKFKHSELAHWKEMKAMSKKVNTDEYVNSYLQRKKLNC